MLCDGKEGALEHMSTRTPEDIALIFPGQGAQKIGMGQGFYSSCPEAKEIFDKADAILGNGLKDVVFNGPQEKLTSTAYCQPAILTTSVAALKALQVHPKFQNIQPQYTAGLSLGEYSALAACNALSFEETIKLVQKRSAYMEEATKEQVGKMAAVIGLDKEKIKEVCEKTGVQVANFNTPQQIVITGHADKVDAACVLLKEAGARNVVPLDVAGAFHSTLMQSAGEKFSGELENISIRTPKFPIIHNVNASEGSRPDEIKQNLAKQITSSVQWVDSVIYMQAQGIKDFIEIGPGKVLKGLIRKIDSSLNVYNIEKPEDIEALPF